MKVVLAGGSGALGRRLSAHLAERAHEVVVLTRGPDRQDSTGVRRVSWDGVAQGPWVAELAGSALVNLAGALVDRRPTPANIELLTSSRVEPTRALVEATRSLKSPVPQWIQMSTLAIYGDAGEQELDEDSPAAAGPPQMAGVAVAWEHAVSGARADRLAILRTAVVWDRDSPALDRLRLLARLGVAGRISSGRQWVSWLHIDDWLAIVTGMLEGDPTTPSVGIVHVTSPRPVRNAELMADVRSTMGGWGGLPTPAPLVRLGAWALRSDPMLALTGRRALPVRLTRTGYRFTHPDLREALHDLMSH